MAALTPRAPYTPEELEKLYPKELQLQLVQVLLRHGERTPVSPRFQNTGLPAYWPYCTAANKLQSVVLSGTNADPKSPEWDQLEWRRRLEKFGSNDVPEIAAGPRGVYDGICQPGELSDVGRKTTWELGQRLRYLYVDQLNFIPKVISDSDFIYIRATPIPRALDSVQQTFIGLYPRSFRTSDFPAPTIISRSPADETLFPNDTNCRRFAQISRAFAQRAAERWNATDEMKYITSKIGKWMPGDDSTERKVAVDSRPRLSGIMDTINATDAHSAKETRLPKEFYDPKLRKFVDDICMEEWFRGYTESREYRALGIGGLMGDLVGRMVSISTQGDPLGVLETGGEGEKLGVGRGGEKRITFGLSGCHDTTLAGALTSLGAFEGETWPPFTSHIAFELFKKTSKSVDNAQPTIATPQKSGRSWWSWVTGGSKEANIPGTSERLPLDQMDEEKKKQLGGYYVRIRYNDKVVKIPGCKAQGKHLEGDDSFCTLDAFKAIVDKFTPKSWKAECMSNIGESAFPTKDETAGY